MAKFYPSIKSLSSIHDSDPVLMRAILTAPNVEELRALREKHGSQFERVNHWIESCYHAPRYHDVKMQMLDIAARTFGVEYIRPGAGAKSPAIEYLNTGDTYTTTLLFIRGKYRVGNWGDIVERGNYE